MSLGLRQPISGQKISCNNAGRFTQQISRDFPAFDCEFVRFPRAIRFTWEETRSPTTLIPAPAGYIFGEFAMTFLAFARLPLRHLLAFAAVAAMAFPVAAVDVDKETQTTIKSILGSIARDAKDWMNSKGKSEISVGNITQPPGVTTGQGVAEVLKQNLRLENLIVKLGNAPNYMEGRINKDLKAGQMVFQFTIYDESGEVVKQLEKRSLPLVETLVKSDAGNDKILSSGTNGDAMLAGGITAPGKATVQQLAKPEALVGIDGSQVFAKGAELYRIEVLGKSAGGEYQPFTPEIKDGFAVVKMPAETIYGVRIINQSEDDVAAILEIDGVNFFFLCEAKAPLKLIKEGDKFVAATLADGTQAIGPAYTHYVLSKKDDVLVKGWYKNEETAFEFHATEDPELQKIAPGKIVASDTAKLGTITAQFYRSWDAETPASIPTDAILAAKFVNKSRAPNAKPLLVTAPGAETEVKSTLRKVQWEEQNRATVSVRYEK